VGITRSALSRAALAILVASVAMAAAAPMTSAVEAPATQPVAAPPPAQRPATRPAVAAPAELRHKDFDPRWRQMRETLRNSYRRWADAPIQETVKLEALVHFSLSNGLLQAQAGDCATPTQTRIAVQGSKAVWTVVRPRGAGFASLTRIDRFDFGAKDEEVWNARVMIGEGFIIFSAQSTYGTTTLQQNATGINVRVAEYAQWGQPQNIVFTSQTRSMLQLRVEHPLEFRTHVLPVLSCFSDLSFLQPGPADVYSVFVEIPADQMIVQSIAQILPQLDADDPIDRDAASAKLRELGSAGVLAALRWDTTDLSEEQKLRLETFVAGFRRRPLADPAAQRRKMDFLIDCLEYDDQTVRAAARSELEKQAGHRIEFDPSLSGGDAARAADALRKELLTPPDNVLPALPATQPAPQV
jgi:hypothetical protein